MLTKLAASLALFLMLSAAQGATTLRVQVVLKDATGAPVPLPRVVLLVSANPATNEPRRVRTDANGAIELKLAPGSYTVESDRPVAFGANAYTWTQIVTVAPGRETVLQLTEKNAEIAAVTDAPATPDAAAAAPVEVNSAATMARWHDSVVEIWTPTRHAQGFLIDAKGLIATSHSSLDGATSVEVEFRTRADHFKVAGTVIVDDRATGGAVIWIDPQAIAAIPPIAPRCGAGEYAAARYEDQISTIAAPMLSGKDVIDGVVTRVTSQAVFADLRIARETAGGPVFTANGELLGISAIQEDPGKYVRTEAWVVPLERACEAIAMAAKPMAGLAPPKGARLPVEPAATATPVSTTSSGKPKTQIPKLQSANFDISLMTSARARELNTSDPGSDFGNWTDYLRYAPPVLLVRVSPQFEESFWKMLARGAASTQGMNLPPLKSFSSNFLRMRAYCGDTEVAPIHPFIVEHKVPDRAPIREGFYVFPIDAFGPQCATVRFAMFSEKDPKNGDTKTIDPKLFEQLLKP